jgi:hypothetical protein
MPLVTAVTANDWSASALLHLGLASGAAMDAHAQGQSPFFTRLPPEIRRPIEIEYLASYLSTSHRPPFNHDPVLAPRSAPLSPLSRCCKRMYREMAGLAFAVWLITAKKEVMTVEGKLDRCLVRRLRCVNEAEHPNTFSPLTFARNIDSLPHLVELEFDWNPRMSIIPRHEDAEMVNAIKRHDALRTVYLRGNVPLALLDARRGGAAPGKAIFVEPLLLWPPKDLDEEDRIDRERAAERARARERRLQHIESRLKWVNEGEKRALRASNWKKYTNYSCFCC